MALPSLASTSTRLRRSCEPRLVLLSPPRTGSTAVARLLWQHSRITAHCHEPFEACYWGQQGEEAPARCLSQPLVLATGRRVELHALPPGSGLLVKEMTFQVDPGQLRVLAELTTAPLVFVFGDPRSSTVSRLRIVAELSGERTFAPFESGWDSLADHVAQCRAERIPHVLLDSHDLRHDPLGVSTALCSALGLEVEHGLLEWAPRRDLQLCAPEVGELMGKARAKDDPFYRRVLASRGILPPDELDWDDVGRRIEAAGLTEAVERWLEVRRRLRADPNVISTGGPHGR